MIAETIQHCSGCGACWQICPKQCITMKRDEEGFLYPLVNNDECVECHLCEAVCHELHTYEEKKPLHCYAAINQDESIRLDSSSGGIFTILAENILAAGGVVFGAQFNKDWLVDITYTDTLEGIKEYRGSKYIQADTKETYKEAKHFLELGKPVLYSGTPCQIAGLKHFLRKEYNNLLTVDLICHGVPSPKVWEKYLQEVTSNASKAIHNCEFRNKDDGWKKFRFKLAIDEDKKEAYVSSYHFENHFMRAFLSDLILRPSCYDCNAKKGRSHSDITLADFWGIQEIAPEIDDDKGTGLLLVNTEKGNTFLSQLKGARLYPASFDEAIKHNPSWHSSVNPHPYRSHFFKNLSRKKSVIRLIEYDTRNTSILRYHISLAKKEFKAFLKSLLKPNGGGAFFDR